MVNWFNVATSVATIIIGVAAVLALVANFRSLKQAKRTAHANTVSIFMAEYASTRMHDALVTLGKFEKDHKTLLDDLSPLVTSRSNPTKSDVENAQRYMKNWRAKIEPARRKVSSFYHRAWLLYENDYLSEKAFLIIGRTSGKELLQTVVRPLTCAVHLIDLRHGDPEKYRISPPDFAWLNKFKDTVGESQDR